MRTLKRQLYSRNADRSLFGIFTQQTAVSMVVYEQVLRVFSPQWIAEIGSGRGALTIFWATWCRVKGRPCWSMDVLPLRPHIAALLKDLGCQWQRADCFAIEPPWKGQEKPGLLFIDGGDKARELREFAPTVPSGTIILCHDYGEEIFPADVAAVECVEPVEQWQKWIDEIPVPVAIVRRK